jgi:transposase
MLFWRYDMAYQVRQTNKKTGITYVYEAVSYWDKKLKQPRNKQVCIGKIDPQTGSFIPSKRLGDQQAAARDPQVTASAKIVGPSVILDTISERLGLPKILKACFPSEYLEILTMAYYLVAEGGALCHCETWSKNHASPLEMPLMSQRITEILSRISTDGRQTFFSRWIKKALEDDYLCYDITSISSYSKCNEYIKHGYNRDGEKLPQLNLAMLFGQKSGLPVYFQRMPGNITDVVTLQNLLKTFKAMELTSPNCVMDRGFYSKKNVDALLKEKAKFTLAVPVSNKWVQNEIDKIYDVIHGPDGYRKIDDEILYVHTFLYPWGKSKRRCYLHLYYNAQTRATDIDQFNERLLTYREELETGKLIKQNQEAYDRFFIVKNTPKRGIKVSFNHEAVSQYIKRYAGFYVLLSNSIKEPVKALQVYRDKDVVEKSFNDLKNQLDMKRLRMHSSAAVDGRLFVQFIALILLSAIRNTLREAKLTTRYTAREALREMETLVRIKYTGKYKSILTELTKPQRELLEKMKIELPVAS